MDRNRVTREGALKRLTQSPLIELMAEADAVRRAMHPTRDVTFVIDTNPNYTNVCVTDCTFCSFFRRPGHPEAYVLTAEDVVAKARRAHALGATTMLLQGGHHPELPFTYFIDLVDRLLTSVPGLHPHLFSPSEIAHMAESCGRTPEYVLHTFWDMGLRTMPGGGAEILSDRVRRKISPKKISAGRWLNIMATAHRMGFRTSATMTYGHLENDEDIVEHLFRLREVQDETGGFYAFIPWSFKPGASPLSRLVGTSALPSRYARIVAVSRLVLDNVPHIQASWFGEGWRAGQLALHAGADDFGGLLIEEHVLFEARHQVATSLGALLRTIREAGFTPVQRTTLYEPLRRYDAPHEEETGVMPAMVRRERVAPALGDCHAD